MSRKDETSDRSEAADPGRREFLKATGLAGVAAAAAVAATGEAPAVETPPEQAKARYRLTPHVERYYFLNRL